MAQTCLNCDLVSPPEAQRCDCGYDFESHQVGKRSLVPKADGSGRSLLDGLPLWPSVAIWAIWFTWSIFASGHWIVGILLVVLVVLVLLISAAAMEAGPSTVWLPWASLSSRLVRERVPSVPARLGTRPNTNMAPCESARALGRGYSEVVVNDGGMSVVVSNTPPRSFCYEVPGAWEWYREQGALRMADGSGFVALCLLSPRELRFMDGDTPCARAATHVERSYRALWAREISAESMAFDTARFPATIWTGSWTAVDTDPSAVVVGLLWTPKESSVNEDASTRVKTGDKLSVKKLLLDIGHGWVAQVTCHIDSEEAILSHLTESLGTTPAREGFWPLLHDRYPELILGSQR